MTDRTDELLERYFTSRVELIPAVPAPDVLDGAPGQELATLRERPSGSGRLRGATVIRLLLAASVVASLALPALLQGRAVSPSFVYLRPGVEVADAIDAGVKRLVELGNLGLGGGQE
jgi:hypothetical protein